MHSNKQPRERKSSTQETDKVISVRWHKRRTKFTQTPNWLLFDPFISGEDLRTWMVLADYANREHTAFPSIEALCDDRRKGRSTILVHLDRLESVGALKRIHQFRFDGSQAVTLYELAWEYPISEGDPPSRILDPPGPGYETPPVQDPGHQEERYPCERDPSEVGQETSAQSADGPQETTMKNHREPNLDELTPVDEPLVQEGKGPPRAKSPAGQLADFFYSEWTRVREHPRHVNLVSPGQRQIVVNRLKYIMETEKIDAVRLRSMIEHFYKRVEAGQVVLKSENLVFAFMADRAKLYPQSAKPAARRGLDGFKHKITL